MQPKLDLGKFGKFGRLGRFAGGLAILFGAGSCVVPPLESPAPNVQQQTTIRVEQNLKDKVDILFMIDNSSSMEAMQTELQNRFSEFFQVFNNLASNGTFADLQIGVVTSDYGAGVVGAPGCDPSPGGQRGFLQAIGESAATSCKKPTGNVNFIQYKFQAVGDGPNNLPVGQNLVDTFTCMASVGHTGCGFEHQLESVYAALHPDIAANAGFLRPDALLAVVFVTNEDDASAPPSTDIYDRMKTAQYGYEDTYRQTNFAIVCGPDGTPLPTFASSNGKLANCVSAPNTAANPVGKAYDIGRYINFFTKSISEGGIKTDPSDVVLVGIDAPTDPFEIILTDPSTPGGQDYKECPKIDEMGLPTPCVPMLQHSCHNPTNPAFFGDPAVRLNTVIKSVTNNNVSSICENDFSPALMQLGALIVSNLGGGCITSRLPTDATGATCHVDADCPQANGIEVCSANGTCLVPDCVVEDVTTNTNGSTTVTEIPECSGATGTNTCWSIAATVDPKTKINQCVGTSAKSSPDGVGMTINRHGGMAPANTTARVSCSTLPG